MQINDEDFDTIFYTYGLQLYQNLPLIEPLESKEIKNVRELIIAIDTSGSVQGDTVQAFLQNTWNLFEERENFFSRFNIHILQCDMMIREAAVIRSSRQFEYYIKNLQLKGFAGTDFRPVFQYADEQIREKKFRKLGGVIYFTDGDGVYPKTKPDYPAAFLFLKGNKDITVPPWAVKYILEEDELYAYSESENTD
jgi:predicted metal-dependent peptidase